MVIGTIIACHFKMITLYGSIKILIAIGIIECTLHTHYIYEACYKYES